MQFQLSTQCMFSHEGHPLKNSLIYPVLYHNYLKQEKYFYGYSVHTKPGDVKSVIISQPVLVHFQQSQLDCHSVFVLNADPFIPLEKLLKKVLQNVFSQSGIWILLPTSVIPHVGDALCLPQQCFAPGEPRSSSIKT